MRIVALIIIILGIASFDQIWDEARDGPITASTFVKPIARTLSDGLDELVRSL